jgi:hypothetical protein
MTFNESLNSQKKSNQVDLSYISSNLKVVTQKVISLLEERLMVNFTKRKIGEVIVRKEIKTHIININVPVKRETLIVEQLTPEYKQLAEIDLDEFTVGEKIFKGDPEFCENLDLECNEKSKSSILSFGSGLQPLVRGKVNSIEAAHKFLDSAFLQCNSCESFKVEITLNGLNLKN